MYANGENLDWLSEVLLSKAKCLAESVVINEVVTIEPNTLPCLI